MPTLKDYKKLYKDNPELWWKQNTVGPEKMYKSYREKLSSWEEDFARVRTKLKTDPNTTNPHEIFFRDLEAKFMPMILEADKHNNRQLILSIADQVFKRIQHNENTLPIIAIYYVEAYKKIKRELKQYLIKSAYAKEDDFVGVPRGEIRGELYPGTLKEPAQLLKQNVLEEYVTEDRTRDAKKKVYRKRDEGRLVLREECELGEEDTNPGGVVQANKKVVSSLGMRDVVLDLSSSKNNFTSFHIPEKNTGFFDNELDSVSVDSDSAPSNENTEKYTPSDQIQLDKASDSCYNTSHQGPFSIEDISLDSEPNPRKPELDDLIGMVSEMIKEAK